jgi:TP901 family phage tail tape measure protein
MATTNRRGTVIGVALQLDWQKAVADAQKAGKVINTTFATALNAPAGSRGPTLLQQAKATAVAMEGQAKVAEIASRSSKNLAAADVQAARASAELAKAKLYEARAQQTAARETERAERAQRRSTFGAGFQRGFASTRVNVGAASPILSSATAAGGAGMAGAGVAVVGALAIQKASEAAQQGVRDAADLEAALNSLTGITSISAEGLDKVRQKARELGADLELPAVASTDAAEAISLLMRRGIELEDALAGAKGALQLATVAQISFEEATNITADALKQFGLAGSEATRVADTFAGAVKKGAVATEIYDALRQVGPVARQAGLSLQETVGALTEFSNEGLRGSDAGTSLKTMLLALVAPSDKAKGLMKSLGIEVFTAQGQMRPFGDIVASLEKALKGMSDEQKDATLKIIFGTDAIRAASIAARGGRSAFDGYTKSVSEHGSAAQQAAAKMKGLNGAWEGLKSTVSSLNEKVFAPTLGWLEGIVRGATNAAAALDKMMGARARTEAVEAASAGRDGGARVSKADQLADVRTELRATQDALAYANKMGAGFTPSAKMFGGRSAEPMTTDQLQAKIRNLQSRQQSLLMDGGDSAEMKNAARSERMAKRKKEEDAKELRDTAAKEKARKALEDAEPKKRGKKEGGDAEKLTGDILRGIAKGINTPKGEASCAYFASQALRQIGAKVPVTAGAKELRDRALKAGYQQVDPKDARAGDLVVYRGAKYGALKFNENGERVGYHVAVASGDGKVVESSGGKKSYGRSLMRPGVSVYRGPNVLGSRSEGASDAQKFAEQQADEVVRRARSEAGALSDLTSATMQATIRLNLTKLGKINSRKQLDSRRAGFPMLINMMARAQEQEISSQMMGFEGTDKEREARVKTLRLKAHEDRQNTLQQLEDAYQKQVEALKEWGERRKKATEEAAKDAEADADAEKSAAERRKEDSSKIAQSREALLSAQIALADAKTKELDDALATVEDRDQADDLLKRYQAEQVRAAGLSLDLALAKNARESNSEAEMLALNEAAIIAYRTAIASIQARVGAMGADIEGRIDDATVGIPWHPDSDYWKSPEQIEREQAKKRQRADLANGVAAGAGQIAGALVSGGGRGVQVEARRVLEDTVRGTLATGVQDIARALMTSTEGMTELEKAAADEQKKAAFSHMKAAAALTASAGALAALTGQQGGKKQGQAVLGALAGYFLSTKTKQKGDGAGLAELGINLATGNYLGAGLSLLGGKLKLPKFATGGRITGAGIVGDGGRPELFVPDSPGYILPDASAAFSRLRESMGGDGSAGGRSLVYSPTIIHQGDINDRADRRYFEQRERDVLQDVLFSLGG